MNLDAITIQDCLDMYEKKGRAAVIEDGGVSSFVEGEDWQARGMEKAGGSCK